MPGVPVCTCINQVYMIPAVCCCRYSFSSCCLKTTTWTEENNHLLIEPLKKRSWPVKAVIGLGQKFLEFYAVVVTPCLLMFNSVSGCPTESRWCHGGLSVLKSHFNPACIGVYKQLYRLLRMKIPPHKRDLASRRQSMVALGKRWFGFRRFKKYWRAFATRAKAHRLDQNWQSPTYKAQRSNHWAKNANLTCQGVNHR